jgi:uncharacterized protein YecE (DUF72 family)
MVSVSAFVDCVQNSQEITHERNLVDSKDAAGYFVRTMQGLDDRLGPLLLQLPPDFTVEGIDVLTLRKNLDGNKLTQGNRSKLRAL